MDTNHFRISEIENSINGIQRPEADPYIYSKILSRIQNRAGEFLKPKFLWISAASFVVLIALNVVLFSISRKTVQPDQQEIKQLSNAFRLINENPVNYN